MLREADPRVEAAANGGIKSDGAAASQRKGSRSADRVDPGWNPRGVAGLRILVREAQHDGHIGHVSTARFGERAVEIDLHLDDGVEDTDLLPSPDRALGGAPGAQSVGARRSYTDLEDVKDADGGHQCS
jgi:hypothetical protein